MVTIFAVFSFLVIFAFALSVRAKNIKYYSKINMNMNSFKIQVPIQHGREERMAGGVISMHRPELLQSFEVYTCSEESKTLIASHIANWVRVEKLSCLDEYSTHSVIYISADGKRCGLSISCCCSACEIRSLTHSLTLAVE